jgi:hypothetical protein
MIVLNKKFPHGGQDFEIFVKYDEEAKSPIEVKNITMHTHGNWYPIGSIMDKFFKEAVWKLVTGTDWEEIRKETEAKNIKQLTDNLNPVMAGALRPFLVDGGELKTINH